MKHPFSFLLIVLCLLPAISRADYPVSDIPDTLLKNAGAVIRDELVDIHVGSMNEKEVFERRVITVLNESGDYLNSFQEYYDPGSKISIKKCEVYDKNGQIIKSYRKSDFNDYAAVSGISLHEDNRVIVLEPVINTYPYTICYEFTREAKNFMSFQTWFPVRSDEVSVQNSLYRISSPSDLPVRFHEMNLSTGVRVKAEDDRVVREWSLSNFPAVKDAPFEPPAWHFLPHLRIVPENFEFDKYAGSFADWQSFGKWVYDLTRDRDQIPLDLQLKMISLVEGAKDDREKVERIYRYLQETTRYVSIQLGIGGFQPFSAEYVYKNGYGDCKALTNYMKAMLTSVGIESVYTLVRAGKNAMEIVTDFPSQQFNHVILCVPLAEDTLWLECTSQTNPFGYLGYFTEDRTVLFIHENGGVLGRTPRLPASRNCEIRVARVDVDPDRLSVDAFVQSRYTGLQYSNYASLLYEGREDQDRILKKNLDLTGLRLHDFSISDTLCVEGPELLLDLDISLSNYLTRSGDRIFIPLKLLDRRNYIPRNKDERTREVYMSLSYEDCDTMIYRIPDDYIVEYIPEAVSVSYDFGHYSVSAELTGNEIVYIRKMGIYKGYYPPQEFDKLVEFYKVISKSEGMKAVVRKSGG